MECWREMEKVGKWEERNDSESKETKKRHKKAYEEHNLSHGRGVEL